MPICTRGKVETRRAASSKANSTRLPDSATANAAHDTPTSVASIAWGNARLSKGGASTSTPASSHALWIARSNPSGNSASATRLHATSRSTCTTMGATASAPSATCAMPDNDAYFFTNTSINSAFIAHPSIEVSKRVQSNAKPRLTQVFREREGVPQRTKKDSRCRSIY